jgi:phage terminase Nu1 subunit (DNA packaging protein)
MELTEISASDLGNILGISERRVRQLAAEGKIPKPTRGKFDAPACVKAILEAARSDRPESALEKARARAIDARARTQEMKIAREERELIPFDDAVEAMELKMGAVNTALTTLPARFTRNLEIREQLDDLVFTIREEISNKLEELSKKYLEGKTDHDD